MRGSIHGSLHTASISRNRERAEAGRNASIELDERTAVIAGHLQAGNEDGLMRDQHLRNSARLGSDRRSTYWEELKGWWSRNISLSLEHNVHGSSGDPRNYLALERSFLGWFRTSTALVSLGVVITQLFILRDLDPIKGKIFGAILAVGGIVSSLLGCIRYFRQQGLLVQGKTLSGGWHVTVILALLVIILLSLFIVVLVED